MPIVVRKVEGDHFVNFQEIAGDEWRLREQVEALEDWLQNNTHKLDPQFQWVADIGFQQRKNARGGGPPLTLNIVLMLISKYIFRSIREPPHHRKRAINSVTSCVQG